MGYRSKIEWTGDTWNPWRGCLKVSTGCKYCYMYRDRKRYGEDPSKVVRSKTTFYDPIKGRYPGPLVFTCSLSDWFIEQADPWRPEAWDIVRRTPHLTYQILTKRPERIADHLPRDWGTGWHNVWLGVSVETQAYTGRMDVLRDIPAALRFVSAEPLLGHIDLDLAGFGWVITGGESGTGRDWRPASPDWFRHIRDQCLAAGVAYFHKQNGGNSQVDDSWGGRDLDGRKWDEIPPVVGATPAVQLSLF